jgi:hypothetical protein
MEKYKRLTIRNSDGTVSRPYGENIVEKVFYRLAELEDKIENGTLIELPCKERDNVWVIADNDKIEEVIVIDYMLTKKGFALTVVNEDLLSKYYVFDYDFNEDWFLTKAEAEAKLKE